ncbi:MAG: class C sortase [Oscillospiraceae bacterium]|nr:class C sortase [Oscillospiraceae bacterium]
MKKHASTVILILMLVIGLSLLLYPTVADWWNSFHQSRAIANYDAILSEMGEEDYTHLFDAALEYNRKMSEIRFPLMYFDQVEGYESLLNVTGNGVMGYIDIPKIKVELPIYHGTSEGVLQIAVGHVQGSSLPTGGAGTHCVLSAHRGLPSARLFTDLDKVEIGDTFTLSIIDRVLTYEVDQILTVLPHEVEPLYAVEGEDYCTLVTCTPYGINSHRLLVRGTRIENAEAAKIRRVTADAVQLDPILVAPMVAAPILLILLILLILPKKKKTRRSELL